MEAWIAGILVWLVIGWLVPIVMHYEIKSTTSSKFSNGRGNLALARLTHGWMVLGRWVLWPFLLCALIENDWENRK